VRRTVRLAYAGIAVMVTLAAAAPAQADPFVYVTNVAGNNVSQYGVGSGGALSPLAPMTVAAGDFPGGVVVRPGGDSVYVTNSNSDTVSQFDVGTGGALAGKSPATVGSGDFPQGVAVSPNGSSLYVANVRSNDVSQFDVGAGGALTPKSPATGPRASARSRLRSAPGGRVSMSPSSPA
jgi:DNA-binding beta-propeller fold protein YncE